MLASPLLEFLAASIAHTTTGKTYSALLRTPMATTYHCGTLTTIVTLHSQTLTHSVAGLSHGANNTKETLVYAALMSMPTIFLLIEKSLLFSIKSLNINSYYAKVCLLRWFTSIRPSLGSKSLPCRRARYRDIWH